MKDKNGERTQKHENLSAQDAERLNSVEEWSADDKEILKNWQGLTDKKKMIGELEKGVSNWNAYREEHINKYLPRWEYCQNIHGISSEIILDFSGESFENKELEKAHLEYTNLSNVDFSNKNLEKANLTDARFDGTNFESANLTGANISGIHLNHWIINDATKLTNCICTSIFIGGEEIEIPPGFTSFLVETLKNETKDLGNLHSTDEIEKKMKKIKDYLESVKKHYFKHENTMSIDENTRLKEEKKRSLISGSEDDFRTQINEIKGIKKSSTGSQDYKSEAVDESAFLLARLQSRICQKKLLSMDNVETISLVREITPYAIAAIIFVTFSGLLGVAYRKDQVEISITYDVGTITGGILAGSAAVIAATAYARKTAEADRGNSRDG